MFVRSEVFFKLGFHVVVVNVSASLGLLWSLAPGALAQDLVPLNYHCRQSNQSDFLKHDHHSSLLVIIVWLKCQSDIFSFDQHKLFHW